MARSPNDRLADLVETAGLSRKALARAVKEVAAADGTRLATDHTLVGKWLDGMVPRGQTPEYIARVLSARLGRTITRADIGMGAKSGTVPAESLTFATDDDDSTKTITALWTADVEQLGDLRTATVEPLAWREASLRWLIGGRGRPPESGGTYRRVGLGEVEAIRLTVEHFAELDNRFGGGHGRQALIHYLDTDVAPLLHANLTEPVRLALFAAVAEATLLAAWSCYDSGLHGLAQRYFIQLSGSPRQATIGDSPGPSCPP